MPTRPTPERLKKQIKRLSLADKQALQIWLCNEIEQENQPPEVSIKPGRKVVETTQSGRVTYQGELVKCGKLNCRCATEGKLHGPYWYGYRKEKGRLKSWYIGKKLKLKQEKPTISIES